MAVDISLLGRLAVEVDGVAAEDRRLGGLGRLALAFLVSERHRPVARDELAEVLWGDDLPATWEAALRGVVSRMRNVLAGAGLDRPDVVQSQFGCYQLQLPGDVAIDCERVVEAVAEAERALEAGAPDEARAAAAEAAELAGRRFLPGASGAWTESRQDDLAALEVRALEVLSGAASACADHGTAVAAAERAVAHAPLRESAHQRVMAAHAAAGNRGAALRAYQRCRDQLVEDLGVSPSGATEALYLELLGDEPVEAGRAPPSNLPACATSFVGRREQTDELERLLGTTRLLTLTGPGGVGKSRLGLRVAERVLVRYPGGVWWVELAGLADPALVEQQALSVLGIPERSGVAPADSLARHVAGRRLLLVLDNCEHLVAACAALSDFLLRAAADLSIVATSREPLGVPGETTWIVPPLATPGRHDVPRDPEALLRYDAVELFRDRALAAVPGLDVDAAAGPIGLICARLEGIPLAIELAAARMRALSASEIATRLDDHLRLLVGGPRAAPSRHRTLRAAVDWSYETLTAPERKLFARLSVFAGGCRLDAAEAVCAEPGVDVVEAMAALVDKCLVTIDRSGRHQRYRVLETLRQYGAEHLGRGGGAEERATRDRHLHWAIGLAEAAEPGLEGDEQVTWLAVLDDEHDNLRTALDWAATDDHDHGLRLAASMVRFWEIRGYLSQGRSRLEHFTSEDEGQTPLRAKALNAAAVLAQRQGDASSARVLYQESLVIQRALGDRRGVATALHGLANLAAGQGDLVTARSLFEENLAIARQLGLRPMEAASLVNLGVVAQASFMSGRRPMDDAGPEARRYYHAGLTCFEAMGDRYGVALALENLGALERFLNGGDVARALHERSLAIRRELGDKQGIAGSARFLGAIARRAGATGTARQLHEERLAIERELDNPAQVAEALADLGDIALHEGNLDDAARRLEESRSLYVTLGAREGAAMVAGLLGEVARRRGRFDEARTLLEDSLAAACDFRNHHGEAWARLRLGRLARSAGDARVSADFARQALALAVAHQFSGVEPGALDLLADLAGDG